MSHSVNAESHELSSTELARELSVAARQFRSAEGGQDASRLERWVRKAAAHVRGSGLSTVDHIVLSGTLATIARDIPAIASILQEEGWQWFGHKRR